MIASTVHSATSAAPPLVGLATFRLATPADDVFVEELQALAFGPGRFARTAFRVRERFPIDKSLSLIAEIDGQAVASVWMTPISVGGIDGYLLGPLATDPAYRGRGAGKLLVKEVCRMALARGEGSFVLLVGDAPIMARSALRRRRWARSSSLDRLIPSASCSTLPTRRWPCASLARLRRSGQARGPETPAR